MDQEYETVSTYLGFIDRHWISWVLEGRDKPFVAAAVMEQYIALEFKILRSSRHILFTFLYHE